MTRMRRFALYSDIHANVSALEAVYADMAAAGIEERYCLGDLIGYGPDPQGVIDLVRASGDPVIQGNYDEGVASRRGSCGCYYATDQARDDGGRSYDFTDRRLSKGSSAWLLSLPLHIPLEEAGLRVLLVHGSPRKINEYLLLDRTERQLARLARDVGADVVCHGHIHVPYHRSFADPHQPERIIHYISSGSVGKPKDGDMRAGWVEVRIGSADEVGGGGCDAGAAPAGDAGVHVGVVYHRMPYDIDRVARDMRTAGLPETLVTALLRA